jgi:glycosyltransferase involved in cell wall biosynthesis
VFSGTIVAVFGENPSISVVIPARNEGSRIAGAIASIVSGRSRPFPLQIVVVDDNSADGSCRGLSGSYSWERDLVRVDVVGLPRWSGIPYARNVGAGAALGDILFITDANVRFPAGWDLHLRNRVSPRRALCATIADARSTVRGFGGMLQIPSMGFSWLNHPGVYGGFVPLAPCTGTILTAELFRRVGGYDTAMPVYGAAEPEFSVRLWLSGAEIVCLPDLVLEHRFKPPSERRAFLDAISSMQVGNYLRFGLLYLDQPLMRQVLDHYKVAEPRVFEKALKKVWMGDVWNRREVLRRNLPERFETFAARFGLTDTHGRFVSPTTYVQ